MTTTTLALCLFFQSRRMCRYNKISPFRVVCFNQWISQEVAESLKEDGNDIDYMRAASNYSVRYNWWNDLSRALAQ